MAKRIRLRCAIYARVKNISDEKRKVNLDNAYEKAEDKESNTMIPIKLYAYNRA